MVNSIVANLTPGELVQFGKQVLKLESISIISNGSLIKESWLQKYSPYLDILAVSCDSFDEKTNIKIGRGQGNNVKQLRSIRDWCRNYGIKFKLNTVVCRYNVDEDMVRQVTELEPFRWKCFQVLKVEGENDTDQTLRDVRGFEVEDDEFEAFCRRHESLSCFVPESNKLMAESYLLLDEVSCRKACINQLSAGSLADSATRNSVSFLGPIRMLHPEVYLNLVYMKLCELSAGMRKLFMSVVVSINGPRMSSALV